MADNNKKDVFHWNFDLKNTDSDFSDIEYSPEVIPVSEGEEEVKPFIFVDGKYNSDADSASLGDSFTSDRSSVSVRKRPTVEEDDQDEDFYEEKKALRKTAKAGEKKGSLFGSGSGIPWKTILIAAAILLAIVILLIVLWPKKNQDDTTKEWTENTDPTITSLVSNYFEALKNGDETLMRNTLVSNANVQWLALINQSNIYESFNNTKIYSYPGINEGESCLFVLTDIKFVNIATEAPKSYVFYARQDETVKKLRLMTYDEMKEEKNAAEKEAATNKTEVKETAFVYYSKAFSASKKIGEIKTAADERYNTAIASDEVLSSYLELYADGKYVVATTANGDPGPNPTDPSQEAGPGTTENPVTDPTEPPIYVEGEVPVDPNKTAYVSDDYVRVRATPNTDTKDNILTQLHYAHQILIIGELDGWYHIRDIFTENGTGEAQTPSGVDGYISKDFVVEFYTQLTR